MQTRILLFLSLLSLLFSACSDVQESLENEYDIIPLPAMLEPQAGQFVLDGSTTVHAEGKESEVIRVVDQFVEELREKSGLAFASIKEKAGQQLVFQLRTDIEQEEGYRLDINQEQVVVRAATAQGLFYATQTLKQLLTESANGVWYLPAVKIEDKPRFSYRGMHLDVARHFHSVETVKAMIDQLAFHKMNTFHWHLTEDQGWRIEIKAFPKLTEVGAYRDGTLIGHYNDQPHQFDGEHYGGFYTQEQIREVVQYAQDRFIEVIPEIELPGHAQAALAAYPELGCGDGPYEVWQLWGVSDNVFCPTETTFNFLEKVFDEVIALFPSQYIHIGGDECPKTKWKESAFCQDLMRQEGLQDEYELQSYFIRRVETYLNSKGRQIIGWDEILEGGLAPNATIMSWRGIEGGIEAAKAGHNVIMTPTSHCYLDYYQSDHPDEPLAIGGLLPLEKVYSYEPVPEELSSAEAQYVLGSQVNLWTEYIPSREKLEYMLFPRLCASAEVGWSTEKRDFEYFVDRLIPHLKRLEEMGVQPANHLYDIRAEKISGGGQIDISLSALAKDAAIHYTLDGSTPSTESPVCSESIGLAGSATVRAQAFLEGEPRGRAWQQQVNWHLAAGHSLELEHDPHLKYSSGGPAAVINGINGSDERYGDDEWLGFDGKDCIATIDLGEATAVKQAQFRFFKGEGQWIYLPRKISVMASSDGEDFVEIGTLEDVSGDSKVVSPVVKLVPTTAQYLKVEIQNYGIIPEGAQGGGNPAWLFVDEITIQ